VLVEPASSCSLHWVLTQRRRLYSISMILTTDRPRILENFKRPYLWTGCPIHSVFVRDRRIGWKYRFWSRFSVSARSRLTLDWLQYEIFSVKVEIFKLLDTAFPMITNNNNGDDDDCGYFVVLLCGRPKGIVGHVRLSVCFSVRHSCTCTGS